LKAQTFFWAKFETNSPIGGVILHCLACVGSTPSVNNMIGFGCTWNRKIRGAKEDNNKMSWSNHITSTQNHLSLLDECSLTNVTICRVTQITFVDPVVLRWNAIRNQKCSNNNDKEWVGHNTTVFVHFEIGEMAKDVMKNVCNYINVSCQEKKIYCERICDIKYSEYTEQNYAGLHIVCTVSTYCTRPHIYPIVYSEHCICPSTFPYKISFRGLRVGPSKWMIRT
jgi:hypothetical protein